jgi:hypothetical protein
LLEKKNNFFNNRLFKNEEPTTNTIQLATVRMVPNSRPEERAASGCRVFQDNTEALPIRMGAVVSC